MTNGHLSLARRTFAHAAHEELTPKIGSQEQAVQALRLTQPMEPAYAKKLQKQNFRVAVLEQRLSQLRGLAASAGIPSDADVPRRGMRIQTTGTHAPSKYDGWIMAKVEDESALEDMASAALFETRKGAKSNRTMEAAFMRYRRFKPSPVDGEDSEGLVREASAYNATHASPSLQPKPPQEGRASWTGGASTPRAPKQQSSAKLQQGARARRYPPTGQHLNGTGGMCAKRMRPRTAAAWLPTRQTSVSLTNPLCRKEEEELVVPAHATYTRPPPDPRVHALMQNNGVPPPQAEQPSSPRQHPQEQPGSPRAGSGSSSPGPSASAAARPPPPNLAEDPPPRGRNARPPPPNLAEHVAMQQQQHKLRQQFEERRQQAVLARQRHMRAASAGAARHPKPVELTPPPSPATAPATTAADELLSKALQPPGASASLPSSPRTSMRMPRSELPRPMSAMTATAAAAHYTDLRAHGSAYVDLADGTMRPNPRGTRALATIQGMDVCAEGEETSSDYAPATVLSRHFNEQMNHELVQRAAERAGWSEANGRLASGRARRAVESQFSGWAARRDAQYIAPSALVFRPHISMATAKGAKHAEMAVRPRPQSAKQ